MRTADSRHKRSLVRLLLVALFVSVSGLPSTRVATALPEIEHSDTEETTPCTPEISVTFLNALRVIGLPLRGATVQITAAAAKLVETDAACGVTLHPLPTFSWALPSRPSGSGATLELTATLMPSLTLDVVGSYTVRLIVCPDGCDVPVFDGGTLPVARTSRDLTINAQETLILPPEDAPVLPARMATAPTGFPDAGAKCAGDGGLVDPQWVTVDRWHGPQDYKFLEGKVYRSRMSRKDNPLNHDSQDHNFYVAVDSQYRNLVSTNPEESDNPYSLGVEWERDHFPEVFRPTPGDRVALYGYWVHDCGHNPFYTEIHPAVGLAVQRPRPIQIPSDERFLFPGSDDVTGETVGSNVDVPGIVTDIWLNRNSGEITNNCSQTGLHQPYSGDLPEPLRTLNCLPVPGGGTSPISPTFEFNIYLPRDPQAVMANAGRTAPPVPLYYKTLTHPSYSGGAGGQDPVVTVVKEGSITYLKVAINFAGFSGTTYARRIVAGWVYPAPDNWGLKRWKLSINSIDVHDDGDGVGRGDGDWRLWVNTNNSDKEWTRLFDCSGCVHGLEDFGGRPWTTGAAETDHSLGPNILLYPQKPIWVHMSGFEEDTETSDDAGVVNDRFTPTAWRPNYCTSAGGVIHCSPRNECESQFGDSLVEYLTYSGCVDYTLHYDVIPQGSVGSAALSSGAQALYDAYAIRANDHVPCSPMNPGVCLILPPLADQPWHPLDMIMLPGQQPVSLADTPLFEAQEREEFALTDISIEEFRQKVTSTRQRQPAQVERMLEELRGEVDIKFHSPLAAEVKLDLRIVKEGLPPDLWERYFGDIVLYPPIYLPLVRG